jgi:hypothetical protein
MAMEMESCTPMDDSFVEMVANAAACNAQATEQAADAEADAGEVLEADDNDAEELQQTFTDDDGAEAGDADEDSPMEDAEQLDEQEGEEEQDDEDVDIDDADDADAAAEGSEPEADDEEDGTSAPRMRLRDPSTIKRSQSSWMFFLADKREEVTYKQTKQFVCEHFIIKCSFIPSLS